MNKKVQKEVKELIKKLNLNCTIDAFKNKVNWNYISYSQKLSEEFIREFENKVNWNYISYSQKLSEAFIREFENKVNWDYISYYQKLSEEFIREFKNKVNWECISRYWGIHLTGVPPICCVSRFFSRGRAKSSDHRSSAEYGGNMKRIERKQWKKKMTPSGYWDNGLWEPTDEVVSFPQSVLENAVIAEKPLKISSLNNSSVKAFEVTHGSQSWVVDKNPLDLTY